MSRSRLARTLIIANPPSHSGRGAAGAETVRRVLETYDAATDGFDLRLTEAAGDATWMAAESADYDTVIALGGDGVIHEVVNGLMQVDASARPRLGVVPLGSGNDFARTLGLKANDPETSLAQLLAGSERVLDLGHVTSDACPEGVYFMETLSFGLDAAIAIDTTDRREAGTRQEGSGLFLTSSIKLVSKARKALACEAVIDGGEPLRLGTLIFAVQNGPTYGGGFRICPAAMPTDGRLDVCYNVRHPWVPHLLVLLGLARFGLHTRSAAIRIAQAREITLHFPEDEPPCQVDGERFVGNKFDVRIEPRALRVIVPRGWAT